VGPTGGANMVMDRKIPTLLGIERVGSELPRPGKVGHLSKSDRRLNSTDSTSSASLHSLDWS